MSLYTFVNGQKKYIIKPFRVALYAWTSASEKTVYTKTPTPTGGDEVYDKSSQLFGKIDGDYDETFIMVNYYTSSGDEYFRDSAKDIIP